jgi:hypothetical protein
MKELIRLGFIYEQHAQSCLRGRINNGFRGRNYFYEYSHASRECWTLAGALSPDQRTNDLHDVEQ